MPRHVPGHRMPQIEPLHADGTVCTHPTAPSGKPRDPDSGCTGRHQYRATCECGWKDHDPIRESLKYARELHKTKAAAEVDAAAAGRCTPRADVATRQAAAASVTYNGITREVLYHRDWPISRLLVEAVRAHGLKFAPNAHRRLYRRTDRQFTLLQLDSTCGDVAGDPLELCNPAAMKQEADT